MSADPQGMDGPLSFAGPDGPAPRGTIIVIPGRGEQPAVYARFGARIAADAYPVHVVADPTVDASRARAQITYILAQPGGPELTVLVGSDTGALFASRLVSSEELSGIGGVVLVGLPVSENVGDRPTFAPNGDWQSELAARTTCPTHRNRISGDHLVRPGAIFEPIPAGWSEGAALDRLDVPVLGLHGQEDPISPLEPVRELYAAAHKVELISIAGSPHDVLNDKTHRTVAASVVLWLERLRENNGLAPLARVELAGVDVA